MLRPSPPLLEPGPRAFSRLLRAPVPASATLFGCDLGDDQEEGDAEPDWLQAAAAILVDQNAVKLDARAAPPLTPGELKGWLIKTLGDERGVLCAFPALSGLSARPSERVLALSGKTAVGKSWWWLHHLRRSVFSRRDSYTTLTRRHGDGASGLSVYRLAGEPGTAFDWFPGGAQYGITPGVIDTLLFFGLAVTVRDMEGTGRAPALATQQEQAALAAYHALSAAAFGIGPPVFATMLVHDGDEYVAMQDTLMPANAAITHEQVAQLASERSAHLRAIVTVEQIHTFTLADMLHAYVGMDASENRAFARAQILEAVGVLAAKVKLLADLKVLKLSMSPSSIVFCPELADAEDGEEAADDWQLRGYGFTSREFDSIKGKPFLFDFDPRYTKRLTQQSGYDPSVALVLMLLVLLESARAQCGDAAHDVVCEALVSGPLAQAWRVATERAAPFGAMLGRVFLHARVERDALPSSVFVDLGADLASTLRAGIDALRTPTPRFAALVSRLLGAQRYDPAELPSNEEQAARRAPRAAVRERLAEVARERHDRLVTRHALRPSK